MEKNRIKRDRYGRPIPGQVDSLGRPLPGSKANSPVGQSKCVDASQARHDLISLFQRLDDLDEERGRVIGEILSHCIDSGPRNTLKSLFRHLEH